MSANKFKPHVMVLPEDDANRQLVNGFLLDSSLAPRSLQVLEVAGGWTAVLDRFKSDHIGAMNQYPLRFMVLLIDFDGHEDRLNQAKAAIPHDLADRVFVLGALTEPEELRRAVRSDYETIGSAMAKDCREGTDTIWSHALLRHNASEIQRLRQYVQPILFQPI